MQHATRVWATCHRSEIKEDEENAIIHLISGTHEGVSFRATSVVSLHDEQSTELFMDMTKGGKSVGFGLLKYCLHSVNQLL